MAWTMWKDFEKNFCGKWKSNEFNIKTNSITIFLNIEYQNVETGVKIGFNYASALFNNSPFYIEYSDDSLYFHHNDRNHRAEYVLTLENDDLMKCSYSIKNCFGLNGSFEKDIIFSRLSEEEEKKYLYIVKPKDSKKIEILREYAAYGSDKSNVQFEYKFNERENMLDIIENNKLDELVKGKNDIETAIVLMHWFCEHYRHGDIGLGNTRTPQALMEFADKNGGKTNCRGLAIILAHLIRAYNIRAFHLTCCPYEEPFNDCHVIVSVYCESIKKWIMLDPSANLYLKNEDGEFISVDEFRNILIENGELLANEGSLTAWDGSLDDYCEYMAKNLIRLERGTTEYYGCDEADGYIVLIPEKYMKNEANNFNKNKQVHFSSSKENFWKY